MNNNVYFLGFDDVERTLFLFHIYYIFYSATGQPEEKTTGLMTFRLNTYGYIKYRSCSQA